jgi:hypothetical protein
LAAAFFFGAAFFVAFFIQSSWTLEGQSTSKKEGG